MTRIYLETTIQAPIEKVFDLSRDIDVHMACMDYTHEKAIDGVTSGLIELGETVTWRGKHFGCYVKHQSIITEMSYPNKFTDEMKKGHFKWLKHEHVFEQEGTKTIMKDYFAYEVPFGCIGRFFDNYLLKKHLTTILTKRKEKIKLIAENG